MEEFQNVHYTYFKLLYILGLWPYHDTIRSKIKRLVILILTISCIVIQYSSLTNAEKTLENVLKTLSFSCPMILFALRYFALIRGFPMIKMIFTSIENDLKTFKDTIEIDFLIERMGKSRDLFKCYLYILSAVSITMIITVIPIMAVQKYHVEYLRYCGFYHNEAGLITVGMLMQILIVFVVGAFCVLASESLVNVTAYYISGLLKITAYQLQTKLHNVTTSVTSQLLNIRTTMDIHQRAIRINDTFITTTKIHYLVTIITVIISFSLNLCNVCVILTKSQQLAGVIVPLLILISHITILFLSNYCGQIVIDTSNELFYDTYSSIWYSVPVKMQKMVLFILMKTLSVLEINFSNLYVAGFEGFSMIISSSFSYFTVLYSTQ
ncbi:uncharacterized protein LOC143174944 isoform X2 [Nomia melanderi]|uniref:uncharacterized protein LOC143174944 isoform X2 n=1 Tax=Nomia melanderi TaxID=2448451 RepID=UPI003FCDB5F4